MISYQSEGRYPQVDTFPPGELSAPHPTVVRGAWVGLNAIDMMFFIPAYPFWALVIIAVDVVALYALCVYGGRENLAV